MNIKKKTLHHKHILVSLAAAAVSLSLLVGCSSSTGSSSQSNETDSAVSEENVFTVTASFYPMHILAMNLTNGIDGVKEDSMADANIGCIHDHTFSTEDLTKVEGSDVYIENGLGLEVFNEKLKQAYPDMAIIEASEGITDAISDGDEINGHVWTDPSLYLKQIQTVSSRLQELDPAHKEDYAANASAYESKVQKLIDDHQKIIDSAADKKALVLDETLFYLCRYLKMDYLSLESDHEQEAVSAEQLKTIIQTLTEQQITTILVTKGADLNIAQAIAAETGATIYELNSCMSGTVQLNSYLCDMKENLELIATLP